MLNRTEITLETPRLFLEPVLRRHAPLLFEALCDESIYRYIPQEPPESEAYLAARFGRLAARQSPDGQEMWLNWAIRLKATKEYAGLVQATIRPDGVALLAYELNQAFRGQGFAAEACAAVIEEVGRHYEVTICIAYVDTRNAPSIRLLERLGFTRTEHIVQADYFKAAWSDEFVYTLYSGDWHLSSLAR
jgi:[ribosomal protein S5]-alanine N-acetyltransferase